MELSVENFNKLKQKNLEKILKKEDIQVYGEALQLDTDKLEAICKNSNIQKKIEVYNNGCQFPEDNKNLKTIQEKAKDIISQIDKTKPKEEQVKQLYMLIGSSTYNIDYDQSIAQKIKDMEQQNLTIDQLPEDQRKDIINSQNLSGLVTNQTVCSGYANIFSSCLNQLGIENKVIAGTVKLPGHDNEYHVWNRVTIDGNQTEYDLCWDRNNIRKNDPTNYPLQYYGKTVDEMKQLHNQVGDVTIYEPHVVQDNTKKDDEKNKEENKTLNFIQTIANVVAVVVESVAFVIGNAGKFFGALFDYLANKVKPKTLPATSQGPDQETIDEDKMKKDAEKKANEFIKEYKAEIEPEKENNKPENNKENNKEDYKNISENKSEKNENKEVEDKEDR